MQCDACAGVGAGVMVAMKGVATQLAARDNGHSPPAGASDLGKLFLLFGDDIVLDFEVVAAAMG